MCLCTQKIMSCFLIWTLNETDNVCLGFHVPLRLCAHMFLCTETDTDKHTPSWHVQIHWLVWTLGTLHRLRCRKMRTCVICFHPDGGYNGFWGLAHFASRSPMTKICGAIKMLLTHLTHHSQLTAAARLHDADKAQKVTWKGSTPFWQSDPLLRAEETHLKRCVGGFPSKSPSFYEI